MSIFRSLPLSCSPFLEHSPETKRASVSRSAYYDPPTQRPGGHALAVKPQSIRLQCCRLRESAYENLQTALNAWFGTPVRLVSCGLCRRTMTVSSASAVARLPLRLRQLGTRPHRSPR